MVKTWEEIVKPKELIALDELDVIIEEGEPLSFPIGRRDLYKNVIDYWNQVVAEGLASGNKYAAKIGPKLRLSSAELNGANLQLRMSMTNYADFIGTNIQATKDPKFRERLMDAGRADRNDENAYFANPLAVCSFVYGHDQDGKLYVAVGLRSEEVAVYPGEHHVFGGVMGFNKEREISIEQHITKELNKELGLTSEMKDLQFYGIIRQGLSRHPEVICGVEVTVRPGELISLWENAPHKSEHEKLEVYTMDQLREFLPKRGPTMVPSGAAAATYFLEQHGS
jgi:hypothetical protein